MYTVQEAIEGIKKEFKEVNQKSFWEYMRSKDICPSPIGKDPYISLFKTRVGNCVGIIIDGYTYKKGYLENTEPLFFLKNNNLIRAK